MQHSFLTVAIPFDPARAAEVEAHLDEIGNPVKRPIRDVLRNQGIHFASISVLHGDFGHGAFLLIEATADQTDIVKTLIDRLGSHLTAIARAAGIVTETHGAGALQSIERL